MTLSLIDVAGANFRTNEEADRLNTQFMGHLGVKVRYLPARLAIARSLAVVGPSAPLPEGAELARPSRATRCSEPVAFSPHGRRSSSSAAAPMKST